MTRDDLAEFAARVGRAGHHQLPRLRRLPAAAARAGLRRARDAEHPRGVRAEAGLQPDHARPVGPDELAPDGRGEEARLRRPAGQERRSEVRHRAGASSCSRRRTPPRCAARSIRTRRATPAVPGGTDGGTIYLTTADRWGNMVSLVHSVFSVYGSRATVGPYGFVLHNRGSAFSLDPKSPNVVAPHKRPFHSIIAGFVMKDGAAADDLRQHGRQRAARDARPAHGQPDRPRHERADDDRRRALHAQPDQQRAVARAQPVHAGRRGAEGKGHDGAQPWTAARWAAIRASCSRAIRGCRSRRSIGAASPRICR